MRTELVYRCVPFVERQRNTTSANFSENLMDNTHKLRLQAALAESQAKGNKGLTEALAEALEDAQRQDSPPKAA